MGIALAKKGNPGQAIQHYQHALDLQPNWADAHYHMGKALDERERWDLAGKHYREALGLEPEYPNAHYHLGCVLARQGRSSEAAECLAQAVWLKPEDARPHLQLGIVLAIQGKLPEAVRQFKEVLRLQPDHPAALYNLGNALANSGQTAEAIQKYKRLLELYPDDIYGLNGFAWLLATHEIEAETDSRKAVELAERACELTKYKSAPFLDTLGAAYAAAERWAESISTTEKAIELAVSTGQSDLADEIRDRLKLYRAGQAYRLPVKQENKEQKTTTREE
jgi:tetratricopeptide (TPR) repeat protein